jgi:galactosylxylosylprotein 3-beta-galactosyltransferase
MSRDRGKLHTYSPFLRGFLPGIVVGVFTSVLVLSLWRYNPMDVRLMVRGPDARATERFLDAQSQSNNVKNKKFWKMANATAVRIPGAYDILVLVHSSAGQRPLRDALRETWLRQRPRPNAYVARFVVGTRGLDAEYLASLVAEYDEHRDLLVLPEVEEEVTAEWPSSWKLLQSFSWAVSHVNFTSIFKCNAATFAILDKILDALEQQKSHVLGYFAGGVKAVRHSETSVLVEEDWTLCSHYLPFPQGGGYVISRDLVQLVVDMGPDLKHYRHDDIALGVWLSPFKGVVKQHNVWFNSGYYSRGCMNGYLVSHPETAESIRARFTRLQSKGMLCESEYHSRPSYRYNWTVPADECCVRKVGIP